MRRKSEKIPFPSSTQPAGSRKRGAQPGNTNALKHGFYTRHFNPGETANLERIQKGVADEIYMLRMAMQRLVLLATAEETTAADWQKTLQALGLASQRLANLVKLQHELVSEQAPESEEFYTNIREAMSQLGWRQE
jgi:hypothetical protein